MLAGLMITGVGVSYCSTLYLLIAVLACHRTHKTTMKRMPIPPQTWNGMERSCETSEINPIMHIQNLMERKMKKLGQMKSHLDLCRLNCVPLILWNSAVQKVEGVHFGNQRFKKATNILMLRFVTSKDCISNRWMTLAWWSCSSSNEEVRTWKSSWAS